MGNEGRQYYVLSEICKHHHSFYTVELQIVFFSLVMKFVIHLRWSQGLWAGRACPVAVQSAKNDVRIQLNYKHSTRLKY